VGLDFGLARAPVCPPEKNARGSPRFQKCFPKGPPPPSLLDSKLPRTMRGIFVSFWVIFLQTRPLYAPRVVVIIDTT
jgi:hypothetical protein